MKLLAAIVIGVLLLPATSLAAFDTNLRYGSSGAEVLELQEFLTAQGVYNGPITGNFFSLTLAGVKAFQSREGITPVSGFFGPLTRMEANGILNIELADSDTEASSTPKVITSNKPRGDGNSVRVENNNDEEANVGGSFGADVTTLVGSERLEGAGDDPYRKEVEYSIAGDFDYAYFEIMREDGTTVAQSASRNGKDISQDSELGPRTYNWRLEIWDGGSWKQERDRWEGGTKITKTGSFVVE